MTADIGWMESALAEVRARQKDATERGHRQAVVVSGDHGWGLQVARRVVESLPSRQIAWFGGRPPEGIAGLAAREARRILGQERDAIVFDAHDGFDVEALGAATGAIRAGGLLLLLTPALRDWPCYPDPEKGRIAVYPARPADVTGRFLSRLVRVLRQDPSVLRLEQGVAPAAKPAIQPVAPVAEFVDPFCRTRDQQRAVEAIMRVATGHRHRPAVLTSDRGRGKSAALGIAAARLLDEGARRIVVTGPRQEVAAPVFDHAARLLHGTERRKGELRFGNGALRFVPPDALSSGGIPADLVLVDEAAAIPAPILERFLMHYSRIAFATTVHGYEGTGRGFAVRFQRTLDRKTPDWNPVRLETPIRWASNDPLEALLFRALLLDASAAPDDVVAGADAANCSLERLDRDVLAGDETTLSELFGLLVLAHYQTSPLDLRHLLDGPNLTVRVLRFRGHVAAAALVAREGGFDAVLAREVYEGRRRPRGHLLAQSLAVHAGFEEAPRLVGDRVMRLAVHPVAQGRGLGSRLIADLIEQARGEGVDYIGSSFGATGGLLRFWSRCGMRPVRVGMTREAASGAHSVLVMGPLSVAGNILYTEARQRFAEYLPLQLADPLRDLDPDLSAALLRRESGTRAGLSDRERRDALSFAFGRRGYDFCIGAIAKLVMAAVTDPDSSLSPEQRNLLVAKVVQKRSWRQIVSEFGLSGRAEAVDGLRRAVRKMVEPDGWM